MNYPAREASDPNDGIVEVREPVAAYACAAPGAAAGFRPGVYDDDDFNGGGDWFDRALREDPEFEGALCRALEEAEAGPGRPHEEVFHDLWRKIKKDTQADIAAGRIPPQPKEYWGFLERKIGNTRHLIISERPNVNQCALCPQLQANRFSEKQRSVP